MTTPARIAAFLSTSALCLGLGASAVSATTLGRNLAPSSLAVGHEEAQPRAEPRAPGRSSASTDDDHA